MKFPRLAIGAVQSLHLELNFGRMHSLEIAFIVQNVVRKHANILQLEIGYSSAFVDLSGC